MGNEAKVVGFPVDADHHGGIRQLHGFGLSEKMQVFAVHFLRQPEIGVDDGVDVLHISAIVYFVDRPLQFFLGNE